MILSSSPAVFLFFKTFKKLFKEKRTNKTPEKTRSQLFSTLLEASGNLGYHLHSSWPNFFYFGFSRRLFTVFHADLVFALQFSSHNSSSLTLLLFDPIRPLLIWQNRC